ncbi:yjfJ-like protein [Microthyrium microscopicum]|uniref:YjfJ-like protein n=1 Tax=Microthyrium microscopicum TaxID=703497 RepID=A0A6A6U2P8_9PEZI|nr:yjfJ-like protein [Microthyrium microscopicum]
MFSSKHGKASEEQVKPQSDALAGKLPHFTDTHGVITTTMNDLPGYRIIKVLGTVYGLCVRSRNIGANLASGFKSLAGGELGYLTNMLYTGRNQAVDRLVGETMGRDGNAIIAMRFESSEVGGFSQVCAYGTACLVERIEE